MLLDDTPNTLNRILSDKIKAVQGDDGEWILDVLGVPYGGPINGKDKYGETFTPETDLWLDRIPKRPVVYWHGLGEPGNPEVIGEELSWERRPDGVWFRVLLDQGSALAARVWKAALEGMARASSGAIGHLVRVADNGKIGVWPVGELSLMDGNEHPPANDWAVAIPAKTLQFHKSHGFDLPVEQTESLLPKDATEHKERNHEGAYSKRNKLKGSIKVTAEEILQEILRMINEGVGDMSDDIEDIKAEDDEELDKDELAEAVKALQTKVEQLVKSDTGSDGITDIEGVKSFVKSFMEKREDELRTQLLQEVRKLSGRRKDAMRKAMKADRLQAAQDAPAENRVPGFHQPDGEMERVKSQNVNLNRTDQPGLKSMINQLRGRQTAGIKAQNYEIGELGGYTLADGIATDILPKLEASLVFTDLGVKTTPMTGLARMPIIKQTVSPDAFWVGVNTEVPEGENKDEMLYLVPKPVAARVVIPNLWLDKSIPNAEQQIRDSILTKLRLKIQEGGIFGEGAVTGSNTGSEPLGLTNVPNVQSVILSTNGRKPIKKDMADAKAAVEAADVELDTTGGWLMHPNGVNYFEDLDDTTGQPIPIAALNKGFPFVSTTQVPTNLTTGSSSDTSQIIFGRWNYLDMGLGSEIEILVNPFVKQESLQTVLMAWTTADFVVHYPEAFYIMNGVKYS